MTTLIFLLVLVALVAVIVLRPLWVRDCDTLTDFGFELPPSDEQIQRERERSIAAIRDLEFALAEGKIDKKVYEVERERLTKETELAVARLRRKRESARKVPLERAGTYPMIGTVAGVAILVSTIGVTIYLNQFDVSRTVSPHASEQIPLSAQASAPSQTPAPGNMAANTLPPDHPKLKDNAPIFSENGAPDPAAMVRRLEERIAKGKPTSRDLAMLARSYRVLGREDEILEMYRKAVAQAPNDADILFLYGTKLFDSGDDGNRDEANTTFDRVLELRPDMPEALWFKSLIHVKRHEIEPAKKILTRLQTLVTDNPVAKEAVASLLTTLNAKLSPADGNQHPSPRSQQ